MRRTSCMVSCVSAALMPAVGSSRQSNDGSVASAMPISRLRCSPCDRLAASSSALLEQADRVERGFRLLVDVGESVVVRDHVPGVPARLRGDAHVLQHRGIGQDVGDLVGARDALLRDHVGRQPGDVLAVEHDAPAVGRSTPVRQLKKVLLPAPFGPMMARTSSRSNLEIDLESAASPPKRTVNSSVLRIGADAAPRLVAGERMSVDGSTLTYAAGNLQAGGTMVLSFGTVSKSL